MSQVLKKPRGDLPSERPVTIYLNKKELLTIQATPKNLDELAVGFLYGEGLIGKRADLKSVLVDGKKGLVWVEASVPSNLDELIHKRFLTSGCGKGWSFSSVTEAWGIKKIASQLKVPAKEITNLMKQMTRGAVNYQKTGGLHASMMAGANQEVLWIREDVGRHNTLDKVLGKSFLDGVNSSKVLVLTTGRISYEMVTKVAKAGVPIVVSRTAVTDLAADLGREIGLTVVGYARAGRMSVYTHDWRVLT